MGSSLLGVAFGRGGLAILVSHLFIAPLWRISVSGYFIYESFLEPENMRLLGSSPGHAPKAHRQGLPPPKGALTKPRRAPAMGPSRFKSQ